MHLQAVSLTILRLANSVISITSWGAHQQKPLNRHKTQSLQDPALYEKLEEPSDDENDMLDLAYGLTET